MKYDALRRKKKSRKIQGGPKKKPKVIMNDLKCCGRYMREYALTTFIVSIESAKKFCNIHCFR